MKKVYLLTFFLAILLSGHSQLKKFTVEVPYPPKFTIPDNIQSFTILNRSMTPEFKNYNEREIQIDFFKKNFETNAILLDSTASDSTIILLGDFLFESQRFDVVIPIERNIYRTLNFTETPVPLDWVYIENVCSTYNTDALIVLENIAIRTVTNHESGTDYNNITPRKYHYASMDFYSRAHWRIYNPKTKKIQVDFIMNQDTIFWDHMDYNLVKLFKVIPTIKEATINTAIKIAADFSETITPHWIPKTRYYYITKNTKIDKSVKLAADGDWPGALENWLLYVDSGNKTSNSKIMLNVALAYEMNGDIGNAIHWCNLSQKSYYREVTNHYLKVLLKRQLLINK